MAKAITLLVACVLVLTGLVGCSRKDEPDAAKQLQEIAVAVTPWLGSSALFVAHERGYFRDEGLDATLHSFISGYLGLDAVLSGNADLATVGETPIARVAISGGQLAVVATVARVQRAIRIIARRDRGISGPDDLKGRKIGVTVGTTADFFLHIYLVTSYIDPNDILMVDLAPDKVVEALLKGQVDAVSTWAPYTVVLRDRLGSNALVLDDPSIYTMTWNLVTTPPFIRNSPGRIEKFLRAIVRANRFIAEEPAAARTISSKHIGPESHLDGEWQDYAFTAELNQSLLLNLEDEARWMIERDAGGDRSVPNFLNFIDTDALKTIRPQAVRIAGK
jgi:NitT/TauT family transport system substrate-binding protein